jgi:hypothetical protein
LARRRSAQRTLGMRMRSSAARIARIAITTTIQSGKLTCEPMQNPASATPRVAAPRRHDTAWNSTVTSAPSLETGRFPAINGHVRNRDINHVRSDQGAIELDRRCLIDVRHVLDNDQIPHRNQVTRCASCGSQTPGCSAVGLPICPVYWRAPTSPQSIAARSTKPPSAKRLGADYP